jgi:hypothetical protein
MLIDEGRTSRMAVVEGAGGTEVGVGGTVGTGVAVGRTVVGVGARVGVGGALVARAACCPVDTAPQAERPLASSSMQSNNSRVLLERAFPQ